MKLLTALVLLQLSSFAIADAAADVQHLQKRWAEIKYQLPEKDQKKAFEQLIQEAEAANQANPDSAEVLTWLGIVHATYAGVRGGLGALGEAKKAKQDFEQVIQTDPDVLDGSAYTSLGSLYYQVPAWPVGFGSSKKAKEYLLKGLEINPNGIDSNFFYGDYLMSRGEDETALNRFEKALLASPRPGRQLADEGRKQEIQAAILKIKQKDR